MAEIDKFRFVSSDYGAEVAAILALDGDGERLLPLLMDRCSSEAARERLRASSPPRLFAASRAPEAPMSALYADLCFEGTRDCAGHPNGGRQLLACHRAPAGARCGERRVLVPAGGAASNLPALARAARQPGDLGSGCLIDL